jgi:hypothetical protein
MIFGAFGDVYVRTAWVILILAAGGSFSLLMWNRRVSPWRRSALYWVLLAAAVHLSFINHYQWTVPIAPAVRTLLDAVIVVLGFTCVGIVQRWTTTGLAARVLKAFVSTLLVAEAILTPLICGTLWTVTTPGFAMLGLPTGLTPGWISVVAGAGGIVFALRRFLAEQAAESQRRPSPAHSVPGGYP